MGDIYKEQMIKKFPTPRDALMKAGAVILGIIIVIASLVIQAISFAMPFVLVAVCFGIWYLFGQLNQEFEYIFTNGDLDIDCIYNKSRRKRMYSGNVKSFEIMCHVSERGYDAAFGTATDKKDYSSGKVNDHTYMFLANYKGKKLKITFEPNEELLKSMVPYLGQRKLIIKK